MCGYWYSNNTLPTDNDLTNIKRRGPDGFQRLENSLGNFSHSLLITKPPRYDQPAINSYGVLLYNGSTYNVQGNDTKWILENLSDNKNDCIEFIKCLRGEYSLTWVTEDFIIFCADQFSTRSLWFYYSQEHKHISISSTPDVLRKLHTGAWPCEENIIYSIDKKSWSIEQIINTHWNLSQTVTNYDRVFEAFEQAVDLRYSDNALVPISSGYDSGIIACCLSERLKKSISTCCFRGNENLKVLSSRLSKHKGIILKDQGTPEEYKLDIKQITQQEESTGISADRYYILCNYSNSINKFINLTGRGGDELYSDYGFLGQQLTSHSRFGGYFPDQLSLIWPWHHRINNLIETNVLQDFMYGYHGMEARIPLQDQFLVQAWLNTTHDLKNSRYKGWMSEYMELFNYPFDENDLKLAGFPSVSQQ